MNFRYSLEQSIHNYVASLSPVHVCDAQFNLSVVTDTKKKKTQYAKGSKAHTHIPIHTNTYLHTHSHTHLATHTLLELKQFS